MKTVTYNKLVRDKIPSLIEILSNTKAVYTTIDDDQVYINELIFKLKEEVDELTTAIREADKDKIMEEIADIMTVIDTIGEIYNISPWDLLELKTDKYAAKGGFKKRIYLKEVQYYDDDDCKK